MGLQAGQRVGDTREGEQHLSTRGALQPLGRVWRHPGLYCLHLGSILRSLPLIGGSSIGIYCQPYQSRDDIDGATLEKDNSGGVCDRKEVAVGAVEGALRKR